MSAARPNYDGRIFGENGGPDVHVPTMFWRKVGFLLFSLALLGVGLWMLWDPGVRLIGGEVAEGRISRLERTQPGVARRIIRYPITIEEEAYTVHYDHFVEVEGTGGKTATYLLGVSSRKMPYANVNDLVTVAYFPGEEVAFALYHHRTWSFGIGFLCVGGVLTMLAWSTVRAVGKPIVIDPEAPLEPEAVGGPEQLEIPPQAAGGAAGTVSPSETEGPLQGPVRERDDEERKE